MKHGLPAGISALVAGLQPLATGLLARPLLGERVSARRWTGIGIGFLGAALVVAPKLGDGGVPPLALGICVLGMLSITLGTIWQKRHASHVDMRAGAVIQFSACAIVFAPLALLVESSAVRWTGEFVLALGWSVLVLSVGAISLLYWLLKHGAASGVARLFYLVPPVTAVMAFFAFGERLDALAIAGMLVVMIAVWLARTYPEADEACRQPVGAAGRQRELADPEMRCVAPLEALALAVLAIAEQRAGADHPGDGLDLFLAGDVHGGLRQWPALERRTRAL